MNQDFGNLTFVINKINYDLPSHHWSHRVPVENRDEGGICLLGVNPLDIY